jgi:hypothetical protein
MAWGRAKMQPPALGKLLSGRSSACETKIARLNHLPSRRNLLPASGACPVSVMSRCNLADLRPPGAHVLSQDAGSGRLAACRAVGMVSDLARRPLGPGREGLRRQGPRREHMPGRAGCTTTCLCPSPC